jgi:hypothetical protein
LRDPFGRVVIGVKRGDDMRRTPPPRRVLADFERGGYWYKGEWVDETRFGELAAEHQDIGAALRMTESSLEHWQKCIDMGRRDWAQTDVERAYGTGKILDEVMVEKAALADAMREERRQIDMEIAFTVWDQMYPNAPSPWEYDQREHLEVHEGQAPLDFDHQWFVIGELWAEICEHFADPGFAEDASILTAMFERLGVLGICDFLNALRAGHFQAIQRFCDLITEQEKSAGFDCHNRLRARRTLVDGGRVVIVIDQPGNPDYRPPFVACGQRGPFAVRRRGNARARQSQGRPCRRRGSRRVPSRSAGGGSDDPGGEPEPAPSRWPIKASIGRSLRPAHGETS